LVKQVDFSADSPARLRAAGYEIDFRSSRQFPAEFSLERPCVVQGSVHTDLPVSIGAFSAIYGGRIRCLRVGRYCSISGDLQTGWDDHPTNWATSSMVGYVADVHKWATLTGHPERRTQTKFNSMRGVTTIGNDVWIGYGVFIRSGVSIGDGAIVAARSVVLSDVPAYCIVGGSPARIIRSRFEPQLITELSALEWWKYNILRINQPDIADPWAFCEQVRNQIEAGQLEEYAPTVADPGELARVTGSTIKDV
jgi:acetyltransferase-like isoleucine patch superfamily enzyme